MITKNNIVKFVVAIALMIAATVGTGVVGEQVGLDVTPAAYAGNSCSSGSGGGC